MNKIDITFGIPVYNSEKYIGDLLECFKKNTTINYEIVIVNDGSTDNSLKIIKQANIKNLKIINQSNQGVSKARNTIIKNASGYWITFIDSDDLINIDEYEKVVNNLLYLDYDYYVDSRNLISSRNITKLIENEIINSPCGKFYKLSILRKFDILFDERYDLGEDLLFNLEYFKHASNYKVFNSNMYCVRKDNNNSLSRKYRDNKYDVLLEVNKKCKSIFKNKKYLKSLEYIKIKNSISCVKDMYRYNIPNAVNIVNKMKHNYKREYIILNSFKTTLIYNMWYIFPASLIYIIVKEYNVLRRKNEKN